MKNVDRKNIVNLHLSVRINFLFNFFKSIFSFILLNSTILSCHKAKFFIMESNNLEINVEYNIWGNWYKKLNFPLSSYILCIVSSLKNKAFTVKFKLNEKKNKKIFTIYKL
jgi:hypothetical protein